MATDPPRGPSGWLKVRYLREGEGRVSVSFRRVVKVLPELSEGL